MKNVISIDIGGTKTIEAIFSEDGEILKKIRILTNPKAGPDNLLNSLYEVIDELLTVTKIDAIGIGSAGRVNFDDGSIFYASDNIPGWTGVKLKELIENRYGILTVVENDCRVAGYGEEWKGNAINCDNYVSLILGTGVGAAVKSEGNMLHGSHWSAGELGHVILYPDGRQCNCGLKGCVEQYCSGTALVKIYNESAKEKIETGYDFFELVEKKDELALKVLDNFVNDLYNTCLMICNFVDPDKIIIGGGISDTREYWWDKLQKKIEESPLSNLYKPVVLPASLGNKAGIYGAAYLAFNVLKNK